MYLAVHVWWKITARIWRFSPSISSSVSARPQFIYNKIHCFSYLWSTYTDLENIADYINILENENSSFLGSGSHESSFSILGTRKWCSSDFCSAFLGCYYFGVIYYLQDQLFLTCHWNRSFHDRGRADNSVTLEAFGLVAHILWLVLSNYQLH